jgi:hypothetical protein
MRAKMVVESVNRVVDTAGQVSQEEMRLRAVYGPDGSVNSSWSKWTPNGSLQLTVNNPAAFGKVIPGQFYIVDLTLTDKDG